MKLIALLFGIFVVAIGSLGIVVPELFVSTVGFFQLPPAIYFAAVIRVAVGIVLIRVAPASRAPMALRVLGFLIFIGGVLTPFIGIQFAGQIFDWWTAGGPMLVRMWACAGLVIGIFVIYAVAPNPRTS